jgi:hypothetical protein
VVTLAFYINSVNVLCRTYFFIDLVPEVFEWEILVENLNDWADDSKVDTCSVEPEEDDPNLYDLFAWPTSNA